MSCDDLWGEVQVRIHRRVHRRGRIEDAAHQDRAPNKGRIDAARPPIGGEPDGAQMRAR
jgi:hypothetical protein